MATLLRSSRYIRCLTSFTRRIALNNGKCINDCEFQSRCVSLQRKHEPSGVAFPMLTDSNIESKFFKLDLCAKQYGRVFKQNIDHLLSDIRNTENVSSEHALMLIRCCGNLMPDESQKTKMQLVHEIWNTVEMLNTPMDVFHYNALLRVYLDNDYTFSPTEFLTKMEEKGITPNIITYQRFITYYCQKGDITGAIKMLECMKEKQIPVNESIFNALITGHSQAGDMESAIDVLNIMKQNGMKLSADTYTALMCAYARRGDIESIQKTFADCESKNILFLDKDIMDIIYCLAANGHTEHVDKMISLMTKGINYNFDAMHLILKLVDIGQEDIALKILLSTPLNTRGDNHNSSLELFFTRKLVKSNVPIEKTIKICKYIMESSLNNKVLSSAVHTSYFENNADQTLALLATWKESGASIKEHYFWPLLTKHGNANDFHGILEIIQRMVDEFQVVPTFETLIEFVVPYSVGTVNEIISTLINCKIPFDTIARSLICYLLSENKIRQASKLIRRTAWVGMSDHIYEPAINALARTNDAQSFVNILLCLYEATINSDQTQVNSNNSNGDVRLPAASIQLVDRYIRGCMNLKHETKKAVLRYMLEVKLGISKELAHELKETMEHESQINIIIDTLSSGNLVPKITNVSELWSPFKFNFDIWKKNMEDLESKGELTVEMKRNMLEYICSRKNVDYVEKFIERLKPEDFDASPLLYKPIINFYIEAGKVDEVEKYLNEVKSKGIEFGLSVPKVIQFMTCLVNNDRFDDAIQFLMEQPQQEGVFKVNSHQILCRHLLDNVAETGNVERLNTLFDTLNDKHYLFISGITLAPLLKIHLIREDLKAALEVFESIYNKYNITLCKQELMIKFINAEDALSLQKITDLSIRLHGETNSLQDLVIAFIYCGRSRQARKILETPGLTLHVQKFLQMFNYFKDDEKKITYFENLIDITKGLNMINRSVLYETLMNVYKVNNNWKGALNLWIKMQEEEQFLKPSTEFVITLTNLLTKNDQPIPLILSKINNVESNTQFLKAVKAKDWTQAENTLSKLINNGVSSVIQNTSTLIRALIDDNELDKAVSYIKHLMTEYNTKPDLKLVKELLVELALERRINDIMQLKNFLSPNIKTYADFQKFLTSAYELADHPTHFLDTLKKEIEQKEFIQFYENSFFIDVMVKMLDKYPDLIEKFEKLSKEFVTNNAYYIPLRALWTYYFIKHRPEADTIWFEYLETYPHFTPQFIITFCNKNQDSKLLKKLLTLVKNRSLLLQGKLYNALLGIEIDQGHYTDGLNTLRTAEKLLPAAFFSPKLISRLQEGLQQSDKTVELTDCNERVEEVNN